MMFSISSYADFTNYTYNYDYWYEQVASPDAYRPVTSLNGVDLGITNFVDPQGLFISENRIYVCDSGNNRIVLIEHSEADATYKVKAIHELVVIDGEDSPFNYPMDLFETPDGEIYIADTNNQRILKLDMDFNVLNIIYKPSDASISDTADFLPCKLIVDKAKRIYVQARNINKGLLEFDSECEFSGYLGANKVQVNFIDYVWKTFLSTDAQRSQMELFVPTEYNNVALDYDGFVYTTTSTFNQGLILTADPVRRLNAMGTDILVRSSAEDPPIGDLSWGSSGGVSGSSRFVDVVALENDSYCCLDKTRSRLFMYDFQGNMLYAFGGIGNKLGYFNTPVAIDEMGYSLFVLDSKTAMITRFDLTDYGNHIKDAMAFYKKGQYDLSSDMWDNVLKLNANYDLAYIGKGRAALRNGDYQDAMHFYKIKNDQENYGKAFTLYRKQWMEEHLVTIIIIVVAVVVAWKIFRFILKLRKKRKAGVN